MNILIGFIGLCAGGTANLLCLYTDERDEQK